jgi:hypothetical protein
MIQKIARIYLGVFIGAICLFLLYSLCRLIWVSSGIWGIAGLIAVILFIIAVIITGEELER